MAFLAEGQDVNASHIKPGILIFFAILSAFIGLATILSALADKKLKSPLSIIGVAVSGLAMAIWSFLVLIPIAIAPWLVVFAVTLAVVEGLGVRHKDAIGPSFIMSVVGCIMIIAWA